MKLFDQIKIGIWNIKANRNVAKRVIVGMVFVLMFLECSFALIVSYQGYQKEYNKRHRKDCFYFTESLNRKAVKAWSEKVGGRVQEVKKKNAVEEAVGFFNIEPTSIRDMEVGNVCIRYKDKTYTFNEKKWNGENRGDEDTLAHKNSLFKMNLSVKGIENFPSYVSQNIKGRMPMNPGEILVDEYFVSKFDISKLKNEILGKNINLVFHKKKTEKTFLKNYKVVGIFDSQMIDQREGADLSNREVNHFYVNLRKEDCNSYSITYEKVRYYFDDYYKYYEANQNKKQLLTQEDNGNIEDEDELLPSLFGSRYCILNYIMRTIGVLFVILLIVIVVIITCSLGYLFSAYRLKQRNYRIVTHLIGMSRGNKNLIFCLEIVVMFCISLLIASYLSLMILRLLNYAMESSFDFTIVFVG